MKKRIVCLTLALLMSATQVVSVSASREDELREEQAITSQQLDATYSRMDELAYAKSQLENEISELDSNLVSVMVSIDTLKGDIDNKEVDIIKTKQDLAKAQKARDKQYESMKLRIQALYEQGGDAAWFQMMLNSEDLSELLTRAENTQQMYEQDRKNLDKYVNTINEVNNLKTQYESDKAELEEMKASYEQQSYDLQCQIDQKKSESADYENEIAYAQQQATEYANLLAEQTAEIQRLEAERIAAEEEARRQAEEEAARQAAEEEAAAKAAEQEQDSESEEEENVEYDEDGNEIENTDDADDESESDDGVEYDENGDPVDNAGASDDVEYDEYGNVIDSDNTVSPDDYESEQSSDSDSSSSSGSGAGSSVVDFATQFVGNPYVWLDEIAITLGLSEYYRLEEIVALCEKSGVHTKFIPDYNKIIPTKPYTEDILGLPVINIRYVPLNNTFNALVKRAMDIAGSIVGIIVTSPLMLLMCAIIKLTSPGPLIYKQERVGLHNQTFRMYKFRSMEVQPELEEKKAWTVKNDPRVTPIGKFMRHTSIDELPQLFNILKGNMSLVGPRPERPFFVEKFREEIPRYMVKHQVRPGLTGWAQVNGYRGDTSIRKRIEYDLYYIENWSIGLDIKIIFLTFFKGFINKNAY